MVDAANALRRENLLATERTTDPLQATADKAGEASLAAYHAAAADGIAGPAQSVDWVEAWISNVPGDYLIASLSRRGKPSLALALEVVRSGPMRVARFLGNRHANGNFPATSTRLPPLSADDLSQLWTAIKTNRPDIDVLHFERLTAQIDGVQNPLMTLASRPSPNLALAVNLAGGFDAVLERSSGKRKRKKHRSQTRKFEAAGGFRRIEAVSDSEIEHTLSAFFVMKEQRFRQMGIHNVFGEAEVQRFFLDLFQRGRRQSPPTFVLHGLEVGGQLRAVTGSSQCGSRLICEFGAIADDDLAHASPGDFLFFDNIREAATSGAAVYDFSVGDEPYKRLWCDIEIVQHDVILPLSVKGSVYSHALRTTARLKGAIKQNRLLWKAAKWLRRQKAAAPQTERDD